MNIEEKIKDFVLRHQPDCHIPQLAWDGRWQRFGKDRKRFAFIGRLNMYKAKEIHYCYIEDHKSGEKETFSDYDEAFVKKDKEYKKRVYETLKKVQGKETTNYTEFVEDLDPADHKHLYFINKGITPYKKVKSYDNKIIIPIYNMHSGKITGYERIFEDGTKRARGKKKDGFFQIGNINNVIYIAEGYATAATTHYLTGESVMVSFGKSNLKNLAVFLAKKYKNKKIIILCDYEIALVDGKEIINKTAKQIREEIFGFLNVYILCPRFMIRSEGETDFNDLSAMDEDEAKAQLSKPVLDETTIIPLGQNGGRIHLYTSNMGIVDISNKAPKEELLLIADKNFWRNIYQDQYGQPWWKMISETIIQTATANMFNPENIKQAGFFYINGEKIVNTGKSIIGKNTDENVIFLLSPKDKRKSFKYPKPHKDGLDNKEYFHFKDALGHLNFSESHMHLNLLCWLALAPMYQALKFVPHLMIHGESGSGKSWILQNIIRKWLEPYKYKNFIGSTTIAAFRRIINEGAQIVLFDEKENRGSPMDAEFLEYFRAASTNMDQPLIKAKPSSTGFVEYSTRFIGCLSGIAPIASEEEDLNRIIQISFNSRISTPENFKAMEYLLNFDINKLSIDMFSEFYKKWDEFLIYQKSFYEDLLSIHKIKGHKASKLSHILAVGKVCVFNEDADFDQYKEMIIKEQRELSGETKTEEIISQILNHNYERNSNHDKVYTILESYSSDDNYTHRRSQQNLLKAEGIKAILSKKDGKCYLAIARSSTLCRKIFSDLAWFEILRSKHRTELLTFRNKNPNLCVYIPVEDYFSEKGHTNILMRLKSDFSPDYSARN